MGGDKAGGSTGRRTETRLLRIVALRLAVWKEEISLNKIIAQMKPRHDGIVLALPDTTYLQAMLDFSIYNADDKTGGDCMMTTRYRDVCT